MSAFAVFACYVMMMIHICCSETQYVPYSSNSPWNTAIGSNPKISNMSAHYISLLQEEGEFITSIDQYDYTLYEVTNSHNIQTVHVNGTFSYVYGDINNQKLNKSENIFISIPIPNGAVGSQGSDHELITWNLDTGDEYGFWRIYANGNGKYSATNGYHYNTNWTGYCPKGFGSRGAGVTYFSGLIRKWEIEQGHIDHAIAFVCTHTSPKYVYPATKSDGKHSDGIPEGTRFQIDPKYTEQDMKNWGLNSTGIIIAKSLQKYGMYLIDSGGSAKMVPEDNITADWGNLLSTHTVSPIPKNAFRALEPESPDKYIAIH